MRDVTVSDIERLAPAAAERDAVFEMDEDAFRAFYEHTSRQLWAYLARMTGDRALADDLLQEAYYRLLRAGAVFDADAHRRHYLFRIATNLVRDQHRRRRTRPESPLQGDGDDLPGDAMAAARAEHRSEVRGALARLRPRDRALLWLAYAQGASHREIGHVLGLKAASIKPLLHRARQRLSGLLQGSVSKGGRRASP
ncbi:MAG: sigma-70 family RNA polymerase sigma factor [Acidobacteriota bacterium]